MVSGIIIYETLGNCYLGAITVPVQTASESSAVVNEIAVFDCYGAVIVKPWRENKYYSSAVHSPAGAIKSISRIVDKPAAGDVQYIFV